MRTIAVGLAIAVATMLLATACGSSVDEPGIRIDVEGIDGDLVEFSSNSELLVRCTARSDEFAKDGLGIAFAPPRFLDWIDTVFAGEYVEPSQALIDDPDSFLMVQIPLASIELDAPIDVDSVTGVVFVLDASNDVEMASGAGGRGVTIEFAAAPCIGEGDELDVTISGEMGDERDGAPASIDAALTGALEG